MSNIWAQMYHPYRGMTLTTVGCPPRNGNLAYCISLSTPLIECDKRIHAASGTREHGNAVTKQSPYDVHTSKRRRIVPYDGHTWKRRRRIAVRGRGQSCAHLSRSKANIPRYTGLKVVRAPDALYVFPTTHGHPHDTSREVTTACSGDA